MHGYGEAEKKTRKAVRRALRANEAATVVVTGCAAVIDPDEFREMSPRVVVQPDKTKVVDAALDAVSPDERTVEGALQGVGFRASEDGSCEASDNVSAPVLRMGDSFPTRVALKSRTAATTLARTASCTWRAVVPGAVRQDRCLPKPPRTPARA